jgi:signal transduction histidine kinase
MILDGDAGDINDEVKSYLTHVYKSSQRLLNLINDMLDISKIESGKQEFYIQTIDIPSLLKETVADIKTLFEKKKQNFIISIDFEKFDYNTDENKLKQVLLNLL